MIDDDGQSLTGMEAVRFPLPAPLPRSQALIAA